MNGKREKESKTGNENDRPIRRLESALVRREKNPSGNKTNQTPKETEKHQISLILNNNNNNNNTTKRNRPNQTVKYFPFPPSLCLPRSSHRAQSISLARADIPSQSLRGPFVLAAFAAVAEAVQR